MHEITINAVVMITKKNAYSMSPQSDELSLWYNVSTAIQRPYTKNVVKLKICMFENGFLFSHFAFSVTNQG